MKPVNIMINGLPGNVASTIAAHALKEERVALLPASLTGGDIDAKTCVIDGTVIELIQPAAREDRIRSLVEEHETFISVDFTHPSAVNDNAVFYCLQELPFVMGTTGGDREKLNRTVVQSNVCAVIAPNMAKQIVGFQAMMAYAADTFPGIFKGYTLDVRESHQAGKADTSGTARAVVSSFKRMGIDFSPEEIVMERDPRAQRDRLGVPEEYLSGHGWHTYRLTSADGTVTFEFRHNVNGREIYAEGTLDAACFLNERIGSGKTGRVYTMIDVLKSLRTE
jgi:4-hydroxy-tetrahydrodipicolinate reductase